ncbi:MAG: PA2779 family protein [Gammaproteobacteria bacterium]|nr:PA2779 family protein [Gammaproteobacteria bacterium]
MNTRRFSRFLAPFLAVLTLVTSLQVTVAQAAVVSTGALIQSESTRYDRTRLNDLMQREQAAQALQTLGVDPAMVQARIQNMTAEELQAFNDQVIDMEAGGSALGVIVLVLLLLILLDLLGVTDVFPGINRA